MLFAPCLKTARARDDSRGTTATDQRAEQKRYWAKDQGRRRKPDHPVIRAVYEPRSRFLRSLVGDLVEPSILDVGCGTGVMMYYLIDCFARVQGVDFSESMLRENPLPHRICAEAGRLPFAAHSFDVVTASHLLHHIPLGDRHAVIREFARVARRWVVLYEPNRNNPAMLFFGLLKKSERMTLAFSPRYLVDLAQAAGLQVCNRGVECTVLPNRTPLRLLWLAKLCDRRPVNRLGFYTMVAGVPRFEPSPLPVEPSHSSKEHAQ